LLEWLDSLILRLSELSELSDYQNRRTVNLSEMLDRLILMETVKWLDSQILGIVG